MVRCHRRDVTLRCSNGGDGSRRSPSPPPILLSLVFPVQWPGRDAPWDEAEGWERVAKGLGLSIEVLTDVRRELRERLLDRVDARELASAARTERRVRVREEALELLRASGVILPKHELARVVNEVSDEVVGFGPIEFLLKDPEVTEVMVNGADDVFVERRGRIEKVPDGLFEGEEAVLHLMGWVGRSAGRGRFVDRPARHVARPRGLREPGALPVLQARCPVR